jgi:hypothetical protein
MAWRSVASSFRSAARAAVSARISGTTAPSRMALLTDESASSGLTSRAGGGSRPMRCKAASTSASTERRESSDNRTDSCRSDSPVMDCSPAVIRRSRSARRAAVSAILRSSSCWSARSAAMSSSRAARALAASFASSATDRSSSRLASCSCSRSDATLEDSGSLASVACAGISADCANSMKAASPSTTEARRGGITNAPRSRTGHAVPGVVCADRELRIASL